MIKEVTMYKIVCDICGKDAAEDSDYCAWSDVECAEWDAESAEFTKIDGKDVCPDCYTYDDDDNPIIKTKKTTEDEA